MLRRPCLAQDPPEVIEIELGPCEFFFPSVSGDIQSALRSKLPSSFGGENPMHALLARDFVFCWRDLCSVKCPVVRRAVPWTGLASQVVGLWQGRGSFACSAGNQKVTWARIDLSFRMELSPFFFLVADSESRVASVQGTTSGHGLQSPTRIYALDRVPCTEGGSDAVNIIEHH